MIVYTFTRPFGDKPQKILDPPDVSRPSTLKMPKRREIPTQLDQHVTTPPAAESEKSVKGNLSDYIYRTGRRFKTEQEKYKPISIRLHPMVLEWAKAEAERRGVGYQSVINETLLQLIIS